MQRARGFFKQDLANQQVSPITLHFRFLNLRCAPKDLRNWLSVEMEASPQRKRPKLGTMASLQLRELRPRS